MKILHFLDLGKNEIRNALLQSLASNPSSPSVAQFWYDSAIGTPGHWSGTQFIPWDTSKMPAGSVPLSVLATNPLARANHTGTQLAATISDFDTQVRTSRLDQLTAPTAPVAFNAQRATGLADPTAAQDAATKNYVDSGLQNAAAGIDSKPSVRVVGTANLALTGLQTVDGVTLVAGDSILLTAQTTASQNGVYIVGAGAWARRSTEDQTGELTPGAFWFVEEGTTSGKTQWRCNNAGVITVGTTSITIVQFGAASAYTASNGVQLIGSDFSVKLPVGSGLSADTNGLKLDTAIAVRKFVQAIGDGSATSFTITHNLGTQDFTWSLREIATNEFILATVTAPTVNTATFTFGAPPAANAIRATIQG